MKDKVLVNVCTMSVYMLLYGKEYLIILIDSTG